MLDRNVLRDLKEAFETEKIVTVKTARGLFRGKITRIDFSSASVVLAFGKSQGVFNLQDIHNIWIREPRDMDLEGAESFEPVKILRGSRTEKPLSFQELKKRFCDHSDTVALTIPRTESGFAMRETFCLICRKTVELEIRKAKE